MNAPLEQGALVGTILTCPLHHVQFDVTTGEALADPIDHDLGDEPLLAGMGARAGRRASACSGRSASTICRRGRLACATG